jgi:hypothetical protein
VAGPFGGPGGDQSEAGATPFSLRRGNYPASGGGTLISITPRSA